VPFFTTKQNLENHLVIYTGILNLIAEIKHIITRRENSMHFRLYAGAGWAFSTGSRKGQVTLPFFKSFVAGGPNSMRGWPIRKLGIGSNVFYDTVANGTFNDKYADNPN